jgi:cobalt-zinc-cadmium efflux system protein
MAQAHDHGAHGHAHGPGGYVHGAADERRLLWAFIVIAAFMVVEVAGALFSGSLALLADAGHMASDTVALAFCWFAIRVGRRTATERLSYGFRRMEVLAAFVNGLALFVVAAWIVFEAAQRLSHSSLVLGGPMLWVALAGLAANIVAFLILTRGSRGNLNLRSAWLHVLGDLLGSLAAIVAAGVILATGWMPIDPILSVFVALVILKGAWGVVRESGHILLEGTPPGLDAAEIQRDLLRDVPQVAGAHHLHVWSMTANSHLVTLHVVPAAGVAPRDVIAAVHTHLREHFGIDHVTVQVEQDDCQDVAHGGRAGR